jgi:phage portal protein BeeE
VGLFDRIRGEKPNALDVLRADPSMSVSQWLEQMIYAGQSYSFVPQQTLPGKPAAEISQSYGGYVQGIYKSNGVVFACMEARRRVFSEARFQYRQLRNGRPGDLFGTSDLQILENPWTDATTGDLLSRMIQDVDLEGNFYAYRDGDQLRRMRPDWVSIAVSDVTDRDAEVVGYGYHPGGYQSSEPVVAMLPDEVAHWAPIPDPQARFRGMSWLTPIIREIQADGAATDHKLQFFENGATPNMVVSLDPQITYEKFQLWVEAFKEKHEGFENAYKTLYLGGGAEATVVGSNFQQIDFKTTQGTGETRIAAAAGVPAMIVGLSEGLSASTYSNWSQARRGFGDTTMRPLWRSASGALENIVTVPGGAELWYDDRDIAFLQEDQADAASIANTKAATISTLLSAGFEAESVVNAVGANDLSFLTHTGLFSVQLQPIATPEIYMAGVMAGIQSQDAATAKTLIDAGFEPDSVMQAITQQDLSLLTHTGLFGVQLGPIGQVGQGKGSVVQGEVVPAGVGQNSVRQLLERFLPEEDR